MRTLEQIKRKAQQDADRQGKALAILNLNRIGAALYVIRYWHASFEGDGQLVARIDPATGDTNA